MQTSDLTFTSTLSSGTVTLTGTLTETRTPTGTPAGTPTGGAGSGDTGMQPGPGPVVLLISGSGPIDRDSNTKKLAIGVMAQVAEHLGRNGIPSFRFDKRGVGASGGNYHAAGFHDNVADAKAAIELLRSQPQIDPKQVFVVGHSEGALIAIELAATDPELAGVVLLAGTAAPGESVLRWQAEQLSTTLPKPVKLVLKLLRQDIVRTQSKRLAQIKATTTDTVRIQLVKINAKWLREFMAHDPSPSLQSVRVPVLAVTGSKDIQVNPDDVERICQLVPTACDGHVLDDITHLLRTEDGPPSLRTYKKQAKRPVDSDLLVLTSTWIREHVEAISSDATTATSTTNTGTTTGTTTGTRNDTP